MVPDWDRHFRLMVEGLANVGYVPQPSDIPDIIYHYTDAAGLVGMLQNNSIWSTEYRFLNDQSEVKYTRDLARDLVSELAIKKRVSELKRRLYRSIIKWQNIEAPSDVFVFSLSEERDDLSQWRAYARDGFGFTVGFSGPKLASRFSLLKMEYDPKRQRKTLAGILSSIEEGVFSECKAYPQDMEVITDRAANYFDLCCEERSVVNKHKSFVLEKEWRLATHIHSSKKKERVLTRACGSHLVNYVELSFTPDNKLPIEEIGIGPGFRGSDQVHAVKALCRRAEFDVKFYTADTPYHRAPTS